MEARKSRKKLAGSASPAVGPEPQALVGTAMKVVRASGVQPSPRQRQTRPSIAARSTKSPAAMERFSSATAP